MTRASWWLVVVAAAVGLLGAPGSAAAQTGGDIAERLRAVPRLTLVEERAAPMGYRLFVLSYRQRVDHARPRRGFFQQRLTLLHRGDDRPVVLFTSGYNVSLSPARSEPTRLVDGNQISVEQRFFSPLRPHPANWSKLTIWQGASDHHRIIAALRPLYAGRWLSTGPSKGGMASIYHRRFYPFDVDGTVAYAASNDVVNDEDSAYTEFFRTVGTPACRSALVALQREALGRRRAVLRTRYAAAAAARGWTFAKTIKTVDRALEMLVLDTPWAFWQYGTLADCPGVPAPTASTDEIYAFLDAVTSFGFYTDQGLNPYIPYYLHAGTQLGWPVPSFRRLRGLRRYPGLFSPRAVVPRELEMRFEPHRMRNIDRWVRRRGSRLLFVYGQNDPWGAEAFELGRRTRDSYRYEAPGANHRADISGLMPAEAAAATATVQRWAGVPAAVGAWSAPPRAAGLDDPMPGLQRRRP